MTDTPQINLDIRRGGSNDPGWQNVTASNGQTYGFLYTGGDDGHGALATDVGAGTDTAPVQLIADSCYQISGCNFSSNPGNQLSWEPINARSGKIIDLDTEELHSSYTVVVTDTENGNCTIDCDPPIDNRPTN